MLAAGITAYCSNIYTVDEIFFSSIGWQNHLRQVFNQQTLTLVTNKSRNKQLTGVSEAL